MVCLYHNAWLESYDCYSSFGTMIWGSLIFRPVLWFLYSCNTLSVIHSVTASYLNQLSGSFSKERNQGITKFLIKKICYKHLTPPHFCNLGQQGDLYTKTIQGKAMKTSLSHEFKISPILADFCLMLLLLQILLEQFE